MYVCVCVFRGGMGYAVVNGRILAIGGQACAESPIVEKAEVTNQFLVCMHDDDSCAGV